MFGVFSSHVCRAAVACLVYVWFGCAGLWLQAWSRPAPCDAHPPSLAGALGDSSITEGNTCHAGPFPSVFSTFTGQRSRRVKSKVKGREGFFMFLETMAKVWRYNTTTGAQRHEASILVLAKYVT